MVHLLHFNQTPFAITKFKCLIDNITQRLSPVQTKCTLYQDM